jgi:hypothetical protein
MRYARSVKIGTSGAYFQGNRHVCWYTRELGISGVAGKSPATVNLKELLLVLQIEILRKRTKKRISTFPAFAKSGWD